jgi:hypothetical protein
LGDGEVAFDCAREAGRGASAVITGCMGDALRRIGKRGRRAGRRKNEGRMGEGRRDYQGSWYALCVWPPEDVASHIVVACSGRIKRPELSGAVQ